MYNKKHNTKIKLLLTFIITSPFSLHAMDSGEGEAGWSDESHHGTYLNLKIDQGPLNFLPDDEGNTALSSRPHYQRCRSSSHPESDVTLPSKPNYQRRRSTSNPEGDGILPLKPNYQRGRSTSYPEKPVDLISSKTKEKHASLSDYKKNSSFSTNLISSHKRRSSSRELQKDKNKNPGKSQSSQINPNFFDMDPALEKIGEPSHSYLKTVNYLLKKDESVSNLANILVYSYPLFIDEKSLLIFLNNLKHTKPQQVQKFLETFILTGFPGGIEGFSLYKDEFDKLKSGLDIPFLNMPFMNKLILEPVETMITHPRVLNKTPKLDSRSFDIHKFVNALKDRDTRLFRRIKLLDIKEYFNNQKKPPDSIESLINHFDQTIHWIVWQIVSQQEQEKREKLIHSFLFTGHLLLESHNFHGAMQVAMAVMNPSVKRLISKNEMHSVSWEILSNFGNSTNDYQNYRKLFSELQDKSSCLPVFPIFCSDILQAYNDYNIALNKMNFQEMGGEIQRISQNIPIFVRTRTLSCPYLIPDEFKFVWEFPKIEGDILDVLSGLRREWKVFESSESPKCLEEWNPSDLATLLKKNGCGDKIEEIFDLGVYTGRDIIQFMGNPPQKEQQKKLKQLNINEDMINAIFSAASPYIGLPVLQGKK